jgi:hypothetical protein
MKTNLKIVAVALTTGVTLGSLTGLASCQRQQESALKPIDGAALQTLVDTTAKELLIPGSEFIERKPVMMREFVSAARLRESGGQDPRPI